MPMGTWTAAAGIRSFVRIWFTIRHGLAPGLDIIIIYVKESCNATNLSILLMNEILGTLYRLIWRSTVVVWLLGM